MNKLRLIALLLVLIGCQNTSISVCECHDLKSQADCSDNKLSKQCTWDATKNVCSVYTYPTIPTNTATTSIYCTAFLEANCADTLGCAWVNKDCTHFTGCTPFKFTTFEECQAISTQCLTDGIHCVPKDSCSAYKQQKSCTELGLNQVCYWDDTAKTCTDADTCEKLPTSFTTDRECRDGKITCTTNGQGCIQSGTNCVDQTTEISCFWDLNKNKNCFWDSTRTDSMFCQEKTCDNAPASYITDSKCKAFKDDRSCTTKKNYGGCRTITTCEDANQAGCVINNSGKKCFWNGQTCVLYECSAAPTTLISNEACDQFGTSRNQNCITKSGGGCVTNGACNAATIANACQKNINKQTCFWDTSVTPNECKELICENLPISIVSASDCSKKIFSCTLNPSTNNGCVTKTCANAPTDTTDCEVYLPKNNCIKNKAGGCNALTTCSSITIDTLCTKDSNNGSCYWSPDSNTCLDLTCDNLSTTLTKHEDCNGKLNTCTNKSGGGCQTQTCENSASSTLCSTTTCKWKGGICFEKLCQLAGMNTHTTCNKYLDSCTFNLDKNATTGCAQIPLRCDAIFNQEACKKKKVVAAYGTVTYANCGWDGSKCVDAGCTTVDKQYKTTADCQTNGSTFGNCVSANPDEDGTGIVAGCIALPTSCSDRKAQDNCERRYGGAGAYCIWDVSIATPKCVDKTCATANSAGTSGALAEGNFTNDKCDHYVKDCIANNAANGCMVKPLQCSALATTNCLDGAKQDGDCIIKEGSCVDKTCDNLTSTTHTNCYNFTNLKNKCTVNATGNGCQSLKTTCNDYTTSNQCQVTSDGQNCVYNSAGKCVNATCADSKNSTDFNTFKECNDYVSTCTVLPWVNSCQPKEVNCSDYFIEDACKTTVIGDACIWGGKACYAQSTFDCSKIYMSGTYDMIKCEAVYYKCQNDSTTGCKAKACSDYVKTDGKSTGSTGVSTKDHCSKLDSTCTINAAANACQAIFSLCSLYSSTSCSFASADGACIWNADVTTCAKALSVCTDYQGASDIICGNYRDFCKAGPSATEATPCVSKVCSDFTVADTSLTHYKCQAHDSTCTVNNDKNACQVAQSCEDYGTTETSCTFNTSGDKCFWDYTATPKSCITIQGSGCTKITTGTSITRDKCQAYSTTCTVNRVGSACVEIKTTCADPTVAIGDCQESTTGLCVQTVAADASAKCQNPDSIACASLFLKSGTSYTHELCTKLNPLCTNNSTTGCKDRTCAGASSPKSFADCQLWLTTCTWDGSVCVAITSTCAAQLSTKCYRAAEGECVVSGSSCVKFSNCVNKSSPANNNECLAYSSTCAIAPIGGCQSFNATCASYKSSLQCVKTASKDCYWNPNNKTCVDLACTSIEQSNAFSTHTNCATITNSNSKKIYCTIRSNADNTGTANGCADLQESCTSYKISQQCVNDNANKLCEWVTVGNTSSCADKRCKTAPSTYKTHADCNQYYSDINVQCTVNATKATDGTVTLAGCIQTTACKSYIDKEQCQKNDKGVNCGWNGTKCDDFSCATADPTKYTDHKGCQGYFSNKCTVANLDAGCIEIPATCELLKTKNNCQINKAGVKCYWQTDNKKCVTPTCANAPKSFIDSETCQTYLDTCTQDKSVPCKTIVCEDFAEKTDDACKTKLPNQVCTTDGTKCVKRGTCKAALAEAGCTFNTELTLCQWDSTNSNCVDMNCGTAPTSYTKDSQCARYYIPKTCMVKMEGGCVDRTVCEDINVQDACTNGDVNGDACSWDGGICRYQNCTDFSGKTHADCQTKYVKGQCTAGANSKCAAVANCTNTTIQAACVYGLDGPCLWVSGKCYAYKKCESISFLTDPLCKVISSNCSVNTSLNKCVPITTCAESNVNGGCVTGYDGECIKSQDTTGMICKIKNSCADAAFTTYEECQGANLGCTTDGTTCVELADCSTYKEAGCKKNKAGPSDTITGRCNWDATAKTCHDETCSEIATGTITTHAGCYSQLKTCSSNGTKCVNLQTCDKYEVVDASCNAAKGTDQLPCFYEAASATNNNVASCRTKKCSDITDLTLCTSSGLSCVSDGTKCIPKAGCSAYTAKAACNAGGTDGICVWKAGTTAGTCSKVTSCATADWDACSTKFMKKYCYWKSTTIGTTTTSACASHTCVSYQSYSHSCQSFKVYGEATQQVCALDSNSVCTETDPTKLTSGTCFSASNYVYTWNATENTCQSCKFTPINNTQNGNDTNTTTDSGYVLRFASIILGYTLL